MKQAPPGDRLATETARLISARGLAPPMRARVERELGVVVRSGLSGGFLQALDLAAFLRSGGYPFELATSSWQSSALCWLLGITNVDPLEFGLHFERVVNPEWRQVFVQPTFAVPTEGVRAVADWLSARHGSDRVAELYEVPPNSDAAVLFGLAVRTRAFNSNGSPVRRPGQLTDLVQLDASATSLASLELFPMMTPTSVEVLHRVQRKLATPTTNLTHVSRPMVTRMAKAARDRSLPLESDGFQDFLASAAPESPDHIVALTALYRPYPLESGLARRYVARRLGEERATPSHALIAPFVEDTYGLLLYQEQLVNMVMGVAGFSLERADMLRRQFARRRESQLASYREDFVAGARRNGVEAESASSLFDELAAQFPYTVSKGGFARAAHRLANLFETATSFPDEWRAACAEVGIDA